MGNPPSGVGRREEVGYSPTMPLTSAAPTPVSGLREARTLAHAQAMAPFLFQAARAAKHLGVLQILRKTSLNAQAVAQATGLPLTSVEVLLDACLAGQLVTETTAGLWSLTTVGEVWLLDPHLAIDVEFTHAVCWPGLADLGEALRQAKPAGLAKFGPWPTIYQGLAQLPPAIRHAWFAYDHFHSDSAFPPAIARVLGCRPRNLVDVGGNTGRFSRRILAQDPDVRVTLLDLPGQVLEARENIAEYADRVTCLALDLLDHSIPFPAGSDAVWLSQFLDCFGPDDVIALLRRARAALAPGGSVWVMEVCPDRQSEPAAATSLRLASLYFVAQANGVSRFYRSTTLLALAEQAGLIVREQHDGLGTAHTLFRFQPQNG